MIPIARPAIAPPIGPNGVAIAPSKPTFPTNAEVSPPPSAPIAPIPSIFLVSSLASFDVFSFLPNILLNCWIIPTRPFSSLPYKNSWNMDDSFNKPNPAPIKAPPIGPPTSIPISPPGPPNTIFLTTPSAAPPMILFFILGFENKSCVFFEMRPPRRFVSSSGSFGPNR